MKTWQKFGAVNAGALVGIFVTIFVLPPSTPVWVWAIVAMAALVVLNYVLVKRLKRPRASTPGTQRFVTVVIFIGFLLFLLDMALRRAGWPH